ncbi:MAG: cadherin-like beta sandwich domain-containing protein [Treponema sp.]|nr:cadherin-like beta sandwich domain-containing protein [Treponema sp.]
MKKTLLCLLCALWFYSCVQPASETPPVFDSDATLKSLSISAGNLSPAFSSEITSYTAVVNNAVESITVTGVPNSAAAAVSGDSGVLKSLSPGSNPLAVTVKAEDGTTISYTVTVTRIDGSTLLIESVEDFAKIGGEYPLAGNYILAADLELENWTPIGSDSANAFTGTFDGNGKTITLTSFDSTAVSAKTYLGIFGYVRGGSGVAKADIKNLTIASSVNQTSTMATGQAIGLLAGYTENTEITGITLSGGFTFGAEKNIYLGGIVGYAQKGTVVEDCSSAMTMTIDAGNGNGLVAGMYYGYVGGFAGVFKDGVEIADCHNTGNVTANSTLANSQVFCGGVAGGSYYAFTTEYQGSIQDCSSTGDISAKCKGFWSWAGGIAGCLVGDGDGTLEHTTRILRCFARGTVSVADSSAGYPYVGGIVGYNYYGALTAQSYFTGTVIADKANDYVGGIAGYNSQYLGHNSRIEDCWSSGIVQGFNNAGGIVGQNQVNTYIRRCYSIAAVSTTDTSATLTGIGGIAGLNASAMTDAITGCVAFNPLIESVTTNTQNKIHRISATNTGGAAALSHNMAYSGLTPTGGTSYAADKGVDKVDGEDCVEKPAQTVYEEIGWDFSNVWKMGGDGYPALKWQQ